MRVIALDIGEKRIGVAVCDTRAGVCLPLKVLPAHEVLGNAPSWRRLLADEEPELIVSGLPRSMDGACGKQAARIKAAARSIAERAGLDLEFSDERLSSAQAKRILREQGMSERDMRGRVDAVAASLFLQSWVDSHKD